MAKKKASAKKVVNKKTSSKTKPAAPPRRRAAAVKLLLGENPQIAKGDGNAPVQAYIKAVPGWKQDVAKRIDTIVSKTIPEVTKAVKWNSPFYGIEGNGWFMSMHCFKNYVKLAFFKGVYLKPPPPDSSKVKDVRYLDIREGELDEKQLAKWVRQAATMPGWKP
jgi:hypothetical protein